MRRHLLIFFATVALVCAAAPTRLDGLFLSESHIIPPRSSTTVLIQFGSGQYTLVAKAQVVNAGIGPVGSGRIGSYSYQRLSDTRARITLEPPLELSAAAASISRLPKTMVAPLS